MTSNLTWTIFRERYRTTDEGAKLVSTLMAVPEAVAAYYSAAAKIDEHNRCRQDDLNIEKKLEVKDWSMRVNSTLLAICASDSWLLYKGGRGARTRMSPDQFYTVLAEQLIDNRYHAVGVGLRRRRDNYEEYQEPFERLNGEGADPIKTKR